MRDSWLDFRGPRREAFNVLCIARGSEELASHKGISSSDELLELRSDDDRRAGREGFIPGPFGGADGARSFEGASFVEATVSEEGICVGNEVNNCPVWRS